MKECKTNNQLISFQQITVCEHGIMSPPTHTVASLHKRNQSLNVEHPRVTVNALQVHILVV